MTVRAVPNRLKLQSPVCAFLLAPMLRLTRLHCW